MGSIGTSYVDPMIGYARTGWNHYKNFVFGVGQSDVFTEELRKSIRGTKSPETGKFVEGKGFVDLKGTFKNAWKKSVESVQGKSFWKGIGESLYSLPKELADGFKAAKSWKKFGAVTKALGKRLPFITNVIAIASAIPNIFNAFNQGGFGDGVEEIGKEAVKFAGYAVGGAVATVFVGPIIGCLGGGAIGSKIAEKLIGKSFTDKQKEAQENAEQIMQMQYRLNSFGNLTQNAKNNSTNPFQG